MYSDDKDSYTFQPFSSVHFQTNVNEVYFVWDSIQSFDSRYCKLGYNKIFQSLEAKTIYKNNKIYIKVVKLKTKQYAQIVINRTYRIYFIKFSL